jgi:hypothetical protein
MLPVALGIGIVRFGSRGRMPEQVCNGGVLMRISDEMLIADIDVRQYFHEAVMDAVSRRSVPARDETLIYLSNLLTGFVRTERLYDRTPDGVMIRPLAELYAEAFSAGSAEGRDHALQKLGDVALFIAGLYAASLSRRLVDVDYYIAMGGNAYGCLADSNRLARARIALREVFGELAGRFTEFVDVLAEVGESSGFGKSLDVLRLYEIWLSTGSRRAAERLRQLGIAPVPGRRSTH